MRLASRMTGIELDIFREIPADEEDVEIEEFSDEFDDEIIQRLRSIGCDSAKAVLQLSVEELIRRSQLEVEVATRVMEVIKSEFDDEEGEELEEEFEF